MIWGLMRHGQAIRKVPGELLGQDHDHGLTEEALSSPLRGFLSRGGARERPRVIWTSPAPRAARTAFMVAERSGVGIDIKDWLADRNYGDRIGGTEVYPVGIDTYNDVLFYSPPGGESLMDVKARVLGYFGEENYSDVLIVSHALILQILFSVIQGIKFKDVYNTLTIDQGHYWRPSSGTINRGRFGQEVVE